MIFPWAETELAAYDERLRVHGHKATDYALKNFLTLLIELRLVLLQDGAVLFVKHPELSLWRYPPFNCPEFSEFAYTSTAVLAEAELRAQQNLESLPQTIAATMKGILATISVQLNQDRSALDERFNSMESIFSESSEATKKCNKKTKQSGEF